MNSNNTLGSLLFFLLSPIAFGQTVSEKLIRGKILADSITIAGVNVVNLANEKATVTDKNGMFFILVKLGDVLVFSAVDFEFKRKVIDNEDLKADNVSINMSPKGIELEAVIVNKHPEINAVSLGIIPKGQKHYTPAERGRYSQPQGFLDGVKILLTGKNPAREQTIKAEKKLKLLQKIEVLFEAKYYSETLKIPTDYIRGFQYYCIENAPLADALKAKNKTMIMFLIITLAKDYNEIIACE